MKCFLGKILVNGFCLLLFRELINLSYVFFVEFIFEKFEINCLRVVKIVL